MKLFYDFKLAALDGTPDVLAGLRGGITLAVNVASRCGLTPQYAQLQALHVEFAALVPGRFHVLGLPCNQFGAQEPGTPDEIQAFCSTTYGVTFPLTEKILVNGPGRHPLYAWLTDPVNLHPGDIEWNFEKFLIGADGRIAERFGPATSPRDAGLMEAIVRAFNEAA